MQQCRPLPACHVEPHILRLDQEGGRFPRERWGELASEGSCWKWGAEIPLLPFHF